MPRPALGRRSGEEIGTAACMQPAVQCSSAGSRLSPQLWCTAVERVPGVFGRRIGVALHLDVETHISKKNVFSEVILTDAKKKTKRKYYFGHLYERMQPD